MFEDNKGKMKLNEPGRKKSERKNSWQQAKRAKLHFEILEALNIESLIAMYSQQKGH